MRARADQRVIVHTSMRVGFALLTRTFTEELS
jgi:hypothetical protein